MPKLRWLAGPVALLPGLVPAFACGDANVSSIGLVLRDTQGIVDQATAMHLSVSTAECLTTGHVEVPADAQTFELERTGCANNGWCKTIELDKDGAVKTFSVVAEDASGVLGEGCATAKVDQDPLDVSIKLQRFNPPACCADGLLQAGEQCECGVGLTACATSPTCGAITDDEVCQPDCVAREIPVSHKATGTAPPVGTTSRLAMAFCPGDTEIANGLRAAYTDTNGAVGGSDVAIRVLNQQLYSIGNGSPLDQPLKIPLLCSNTGGAGGARKQMDASVSPISSDTTAVVYISDEATGAKNDVFLSPQNKVGCRDKQGADPAAAQLNTSNTSVSDPDVAGGPNGFALAAWTEAGQVHARIFQQMTGANPPWQLLPAGTDIVISTSGSAARVAGSQTGFVVVYQGSGVGDGDGIFTKTVDTAGIVGNETKVNAATSGAQDQPDIAALSDGRYAVTWRSAGDIFFQRFDKSGVALAGDQDGALHVVLDGEQAHPAIGAFGSVYAVAWETSNGEIAARFLGADGGFLYNSVNGQNEEFIATLPGVSGPRTLPAVALGGGGWVAIGWQDASPEHAGIYVRRFPLPKP